MADMSRPRLRCLALVWMSLLLAACSQQPRLPDGPVSVTRQAMSQAAFMVRGRLLIRQADNSSSANFVWQHRQDSDVILLSTPLGQGLAELGRDARGAWLRHADGRLQQAPDWQALATELLGQDLPLQALDHWLLGLPPPAARALQTDALGRLGALVLDDWQIVYRRYRSADPQALPQLIELTRGDILARLVMDQWQPGFEGDMQEKKADGHE